MAPRSIPPSAIVPRRVGGGWRSALLVACALGCARTPSVATPRSATPAVPTAAPFTVPADASLAYYTTMRWESESPVTLTLFLERDLAGRPRLVSASPTAFDHRPYPMTDRDAVAFMFPQPPLHRTAVRRVLPLRRLSDIQTDPEWRERVRWAAGSAGRPLRRVELERVARLAEGRVDQSGWALFDTQQGRYRELHYTVRLRFEGRRPPIEGTVDLSLSRELSERRTAELALLRQAHEVGRAELAAYAAEHSADQELRVLRAALSGGREVPEAMLWFHARAHPAELWRLLLQGGEGETPDDVLLWVLVVAPSLEGEELADEVVTLLLEHASEREELRMLATRLTDERLRPLVERWAAGEDGAGPELQEAARWAVEEWQRDAAAEPEAIRRAFGHTEEVLELLGRYLGTRDDPRPIVPVLIDWLEVLPPHAWERLEAQALLRRLTQRDFGGNLTAWRDFYERRAEVPYERWLVDGARRPESRARLDAYQELAAGPASDRARAQLRRGLRDDHPLVRMVAAEGLAGWGDPSAAPLLVGLLDAADEWIREAAFMALAELHTVTLGYDPVAPELERARAIGRWRAWSTHAAGPAATRGKD